MALKSLFDLDPTRFGIKAGAGSFKRVGEIPKQLSLSELLTGLQPPTLPENIPQVTPLSDTTKQYFSGIQDLIGSTAQTVSSQMSNHPPASMLVSGNNLFDYDWPRSLRFMGEAAAANTVETFQTGYKAKKAEGDVYNQQAQAYRAATDPYRAELAKYETAREERVKNYNTSALNPDLVQKRRSETTGDVLAESDLYSENLHNMMIDRISAQPVIDEMSSLFSSAKGK